MNKYVDLIVATLREMGEDEENEKLINTTNKTKLFSANGVLDSAGVVFLMTELEEKVSDEYDIDIILADEKAMSRTTSPFRSVESLSLYIEHLIESE